jgi:hypothetical protein
MLVVLLLLVVVMVCMLYLQHLSATTVASHCPDASLTLLVPCFLLLQGPQRGS